VAEYRHSLYICPTTPDAPGIVKGDPAVDGLRIYICPCELLTPDGCAQPYECRDSWKFYLCPTGVKCREASTSLSWEFLARYSTGTIVGYIRWTNPDLGCNIKSIELWAAIPPSGNPDGCGGPNGTGEDCIYHPLYTDEIGEGVCGENGPCCASQDPGCIQQGQNNGPPTLPPCCINWPDNWPDEEGGQLQCKTETTTEYCRQSYGTLSGKEYEVFISQKLTPGSNFLLFAQLSNGNWYELANERYQSNGVDSGYAYKDPVGGGVKYHFQRGGTDPSLTDANNVDFTDHGDAEWKHGMKKGCGNNYPGFGNSNDAITSADHCDRVELEMLPIKSRKNVE